jgi:hypothetical protein
LKLVLSERLYLACSALVAAGRGLALGLPFTSAWGLGGVFSIRNSTSSSLDKKGRLGMFESAYLKVDRAKEHIEHLTVSLDRYAKVAQVKYNADGTKATIILLETSNRNAA